MKQPESIHTLIDISSKIILNDSDKISIIKIQNDGTELSQLKFTLEEPCIQIYFSMEDDGKVAFHMPHCAVPLSQNSSAMVYFKETPMDVLFDINPDNCILGVLVSVQHFHSLFSSDEIYGFNIDNLKGGKPIIETKELSPTLQMIVQQIYSNNLNNSLKSLYLKGKVYELLSLYFNVNQENSLANCPFMANEETVLKIKQIKDIIIENMADPPSLEELSKMVGLNIKKIKMGFKELYGLPVFTFLTNYKMETAKKILLEENQNVNEVSLQMGYSNSSHFIAAFKKKYNITPKQFTKQEN